MAIKNSKTEREWGSIIESDSVSGQPARAVVNPDGSNLGTNTTSTPTYVAPSNYAVDDSAMPATPNIVPVGGEYRASATTYTDGDATVDQSDANGNKKVTLATQIAGEDLTNDVIKSENRFSSSNVTSDTAVKSGAGFLHCLTFSCNDAAPTAGSIIVYDNTAESGTILYSETFDTTAFRGYTIFRNVSFSTGLYVGFTTTADINVAVSYR